MLQIRNEPAEEYLGLLKEWDKLCKRYVDNTGNKTKYSPRVQKQSLSQLQSQRSMNSRSNNKKLSVEYEVASLVDICYGDPNESGKHGLHFQVDLYGKNLCSYSLINHYCCHGIFYLLDGGKGGKGEEKLGSWWVM